MQNVDPSANQPVRRLLTPLDLESILAIEATLNMTRAAKRMNMTQPALSQNLAEMERLMGATLFDRTTREVIVTAAGAEMVALARRLMSDYRGAFSAFAAFVACQQGKVIVAGNASIAAALLPEAICRMAQNSRGIKIQFLEMGDEQAVHAVETNQVEFAFVTEPDPGQGVTFTPLASDEFVLLCGKSDALMRREPLSWKDLEGRSLISLPATCGGRKAVDAALRESKINVNASYEADSIGVIGRLIAAGLGVAVLPRLALSLADCQGLAVLEFTELPLQQTVGVAQVSGKTLSPAATLLLSVLQTELRPEVVKAAAASYKASTPPPAAAPKKVVAKKRAGASKALR